MAKDPAFLFYSSDFLTGTMMMSNAEIGAYIKLLCYQHQHGHITHDVMQSLCNGIATASILSKFKKDESGLFFNERLETEIIKRKKHSEKQKENALMRWHKSGIAVAMPLENENENENIIDNGLRKRGAGEKPLRAELYPSFDDFWGAYQKKRGRDACEKKWGKLAQSDREACIAAIPAYIQATPDPQFRKDPLTYLNQKSWNDEIITGSASKGFKTYDHANRELAAFVSRRSYPEGGEG